MTRVGFGFDAHAFAHVFAEGEAQDGGLMIGGVRVAFERRVAVRSGCTAANVKLTYRHELPMIEVWLAANAATDATANVTTRASAEEVRR